MYNNPKIKKTRERRKSRALLNLITKTHTTLNANGMPNM
ncbi:MAG: hypothetical protein ACJATI_001352 [Halioglobus sp.]|jgi:hypothetical protein